MNGFNKKDYIDIKEMMSLLKVNSRETIYQKLKKGILPPDDEIAKKMTGKKQWSRSLYELWTPPPEGVSSKDWRDMLLSKNGIKKAS